MPLDQRDIAYLWDMHRYATRARALALDSSLEEFEADTTQQLAAERALEIIGEAARRVSPEVQVAHPEIDWRRIIGLRNVLAHRYADVNSRTLWRTLTENVPELIQSLDALLTLPDEEQ